MRMANRSRADPKIITELRQWLAIILDSKFGAGNMGDGKIKLWLRAESERLEAGHMSGGEKINLHRIIAERGYVRKAHDATMLLGNNVAGAESSDSPYSTFYCGDWKKAAQYVKSMVNDPSQFSNLYGKAIGSDKSDLTALRDKLATAKRTGRPASISQKEWLEAKELVDRAKQGGQARSVFFNEQGTSRSGYQSGYLPSSREQPVGDPLVKELKADTQAAQIRVDAVIFMATGSDSSNLENYSRWIPNNRMDSNDWANCAKLLVKYEKMQNNEDPMVMALKADSDGAIRRLEAVMEIADSGDYRKLDNYRGWIPHVMDPEDWISFAEILARLEKKGGQATNQAGSGAKGASMTVVSFQVACNKLENAINSAYLETCITREESLLFDAESEVRGCRNEVGGMVSDSDVNALKAIENRVLALLQKYNIQYAPLGGSAQADGNSLESQLSTAAGREGIVSSLVRIYHDTKNDADKSWILDNVGKVQDGSISPSERSTLQRLLDGK